MVGAANGDIDIVFEERSVNVVDIGVVGLGVELAFSEGGRNGDGIGIVSIFGVVAVNLAGNIRIAEVTEFNLLVLAVDNGNSAAVLEGKNNVLVFDSRGRERNCCGFVVADNVFVLFVVGDNVFAFTEDKHIGAIAAGERIVVLAAFEGIVTVAAGK